MKVPYLDFPRQFQEDREATLALVERIFSRGQFILGEEVEAFEADFARVCGVRHAVGVANGTDALVLVLRALGVGPGDEVITAPNSFFATAGAIRQAGARPTFCDVGPDYNLDPGKLEAAITSRTKAVVPVHLTGRCCDMDPILGIARRRGLAVIEDAAQAAGALYRGRPAGSFGIAGTFSFHPLKNLNAAGDAGAITTSDDALAARLRRLRNHGMKNRDEVAEWGFNSRLDAFQAALLRRRLEGLGAIIETRRRNAERYRAALKGVEVPGDAPHERQTYHLFMIQTARRNELQQALSDRGIETKIHYPIPIHLQEAARELGYRPGSFPIAELQAGRILSLPIHPYLSPDQIDFTSGVIGEFQR
jgi:dTDP-4-amino-4,6-dideoxygalactose transaminase